MVKEKYYNIKKVSTTSPIEIIGIFIKNEYNNDGSLKNKFAAGVLKNISNKTIKSIFGTFIGTDQSNDETISVDFEFLETINFNPGVSYGSENFFQVPLKMDKPVLKINKIIFEDDSKIQEFEFDQDSPKIEEQETNFESIIREYINENLSVGAEISKFFIPKFTEAAFICFCGEINHSTNTICNMCNSKLDEISEMTYEKITKHQKENHLNLMQKLNDFIREKQYSQALEILNNKNKKIYLNKNEIDHYKTVASNKIYYIKNVEKFEFTLKELREEIVKLERIVKILNNNDDTEFKKLLEILKRNYEIKAVSHINKKHERIFNDSFNKKNYLEFFNDPEVIFITKNFDNPIIREKYNIFKNLIEESKLVRTKKIIKISVSFLLVFIVLFFSFGYFDKKAKINDASYMRGEISKLVNAEFYDTGYSTKYFPNEFKILGLVVELVWKSSEGNITYDGDDQIYNYRRSLLNGDNITVDFKYLDIEGSIDHNVDKIYIQYTFPETSCEYGSLCVKFEVLKYSSPTQTNGATVSVTFFNRTAIGRTVTAIKDFNFDIYIGNNLLASYTGENYFSINLQYGDQTTLIFNLLLSDFVSLLDIGVEWESFTYYYR